MLNKILFTITIAGIISSVSAQTRLIEKIEKRGDELVIPYQKYQLSNGLTLLIHEDHSDPVVHVDVTYHVGSDREEIGKSGFAHFFEHMMFQGSDHVGDDQHFKMVTEAGGTLNGTTNTDRTNYFETVPSNQLEIMLWLEADRMGFLLDAVTQEKFEIQRSTVKNERGQNYDNRPYGLVWEKKNEALYPYGHPYSWPTIGYIEELNRVNVNDLKKFFLRWYGPNNATLTVVGDVNPKEVVAYAEKYFGSIPKGPEVKNLDKPLITLDNDRYISYEDNIRFPMIQMSFPTVYNYHPDEAALDILADIIGGGKTSIFYKNIEKAQKAIAASASHPTSELGGELSISIRAYPDKSLADMEKLIRESIKEFEERGVSDDDLTRFKASYESNLINGLATASGKASKLAYYQTFIGNPNYLQKELDDYKKVTKQDVMRVYNQYIKNKHAVILSVYPKGKPEMVAKSDNFAVDKSKYKAVHDPAMDNLTYNKAKDNFDRSKKPSTGKTPVVKSPQFWKEKFPNGLKVIGTKYDEIPVVTLQITMDGGHLLDGKSKAGIARLTADMLNESTEKYTSEEIADKLEKLGSSISINAGTKSINISLNSLTKNLDATLALLDEKMFHPRWNKEDFELLKKQQLESISNQKTLPTVIANNAYNKLLYGDENILSIPSIGITETVSSITLEDIKEYYQKYFSPSVSKLVIVGNVDKDQIISKLSFLINWTTKPVNVAIQMKTPQIEKTKIYFIDKENAPQSEIRIGYISLPYDATGEYYKASIMNYVLGGAFNSRINMNLREDKGYTYGARAFFNGDKQAGPYTASAGVRGNATDSSVIEFIKELKNYRDSGIKEDELQFTKLSMSLREALRYEAPGQKAGFIGNILEYNLEENYTELQNEILKNMTKQEIDWLAKQYLPVDKLVILVVGDKKSNFEKLSKLGYEIVELDKNGNKL